MISPRHKSNARILFIQMKFCLSEKGLHIYSHYLLTKENFLKTFVIIFFLISAFWDLVQTIFLMKHRSNVKLWSSNKRKTKVHLFLFTKSAEKIFTHKRIAEKNFFLENWWFVSKYLFSEYQLNRRNNFYFWRNFYFTFLSKFIFYICVIKIRQKLSINIYISYQLYIHKYIFPDR